MCTDEYGSGSEQGSPASSVAVSGAELTREREHTEAPPWTRSSEGEQSESNSAPPTTPPGRADEPPQRWVDLLRRTVEQMVAEGATMTAAGVSVRMRRADPEFSPAAAGYKSFGRFLNAAESAGVVNLTEPGAAGNVDILVALPDGPGSASAESQVWWVHRDLWRAVLDWSSTDAAVYNRQTRRTGNWDEVGHGVNDPELVPVPRVSRAQHLRWMREFAESAEASDAGLKEALENAEPEVHFARLVRGVPRLNRDWSRFMRLRTLELISEWAHSNEIPLWQLKQDVGLPGRKRFDNDGAAAPVTDSPTTGIDADTVRRTVIRAVERMPLSELLRLSIPVEYLLR